MKLSMAMWAIALCFLSSASVLAQGVDLAADTWVARDGVGRVMPSATQAPLRTDKPRTVGIFYVTWHDEGKFNLRAPYGGDVTRTLQEAPEARLDNNHPAWKEGSLHWGEPEAGYFLSKDRWLIRRDLSMLSDAGVDVLILDVTNAVRYWEEWDVLFDEMQRMRALGNPVPQFCFWAFNGAVVEVVTQLYERIYKKGVARDFWFQWDGKPLLLYNAEPDHDANGGGYKAGPYPQEIYDFFTLRNFWWGYYEWGGHRYVGTEDNWSFGYELNDGRVAALQPADLASRHQGRLEQMAVTPAQHPISVTGKSWRRQTQEPPLNQYDLPDSAFVPWLGRTVAHPEGYGIYFQDRWDEAIAADPDFIYINDWNEWTAGKYRSGFAPGSDTNPGPTDFLRRKNNFYFVDQYNAEFNRTIQPMKGGYTDNYYYQMVQNIRRYKGVREQPVTRGYNTRPLSATPATTSSPLSATVPATIPATTSAATSATVPATTSATVPATIPATVGGGYAAIASPAIAIYRDTRGDVLHRDHNGYGGLHYTDTTGRNDIIETRVCVTRKNIIFEVTTAEPLTPATDKNWMLLYLDTDCNPSTGWEGFDFLISAGHLQKLVDGRPLQTGESVHPHELVDGGFPALAPSSSAPSVSAFAPVPCTAIGNTLTITLPRKALGLTASAFALDFKWADNPTDPADIISLSTTGDTAPNRRFRYRFRWQRR